MTQSDQNTPPNLPSIWTYARPQLVRYAKAAIVWGSLKVGVHFLPEQYTLLANQLVDEAMFWGAVAYNEFKIWREKRALHLSPPPENPKGTP